MMQSLAFFNNKGGVGKTTLLCNVAGFLAKYRDRKVCIVDADPQCNATQYFFEEEMVERFFEDRSSFTIHNIIEPLSEGEGYTENFECYRSKNFGVDVVIGDPKLALTEDFLASDWGEVKAGSVRGIRSNLVFAELLSRLERYDFVIFDVSPSLGAINRSILLGCDYFISPMSIDIFSLRAFENIASWIQGWSEEWRRGLENVKDKSKIPDLDYDRSRFVGYVTQQYMAKRDKSGNRRAVQAYENIRKDIDSIIESSFDAEDLQYRPFEIGTVPNLFSLIPMSQSHNMPVFDLTGNHGVVGAHFAKIKDARQIFGAVSDELLKRLGVD